MGEISAMRSKKNRSIPLASPYEPLHRPPPFGPFAFFAVKILPTVLTSGRET